MLIDTPLNQVTERIIGAAIEVHKALGPGLLESAYRPCLHFELSSRHLRFTAERAIPVVYKGLTLNTSYRVDLIVEDLIVVEIKAVGTVLPVHEAQVLTYLKLTRCRLGLLINFNVGRLVDGVTRLINPEHKDYKDKAAK
jgi:GxxExxY protein